MPKKAKIQKRVICIWDDLHWAVQRALARSQEAWLHVSSQACADSLTPEVYQRRRSTYPSSPGTRVLRKGLRGDSAGNTARSYCEGARRGTFRLGPQHGSAPGQGASPPDLSSHPHRLLEHTLSLRPLPTVFLFCPVFRNIKYRLFQEAPLRQTAKKQHGVLQLVR